MIETSTAPREATAEPSEPAARHSDRSVGGFLLLFFLAVYLITGGGHGYSPDGEFAYGVARSLSLDPEHKYMREMRSGFSQWGFMVPLLSQPLVLLGEVAANAAPQKDHVTVEGMDYKLGIFKSKELPQGSPTVSADGGSGIRSYSRTDLASRPATSLVMISFLSMSRHIPQGTHVADVTVVDVNGESLTFPIRAGVETAEWNVGMDGEPMQHRMPEPALVWSGNMSGRSYHVELPFGRSVTPREVRFEYLAGEGRFHVQSLGLLNRETGDVQMLPSEYGFWSERENRQMFARMVFTPYNAIISAIVCVLLFSLVRLFGHSQAVGVVAAALYGLATIAWPYSKFDFSEPTLVMFLLATLYLVYRWGQESRDRLLVYAGMTALAAVATKYVSAILLPVIGLQILLLHWRRYPSWSGLAKLVRPAVAFASPFLVLAAPAVLYLSQRFGYYPSIFEAWAGIQRGWLPLPMSIGLRGILFSPGRSFFLYSPPMVLALVAAVPFVRRHGARSVALLGIPLVYFLVYSKKVAWHAGAGWGPRYELVAIPLLVLVTAPLIASAIEQRHRWARYALVAVFVLGIGIQLLGVSKSFDSYLGMFRSQVVEHLPEKGAPYGGADYYPHAAGLDEANTITATVWAWPFSPILAHSWLLSADVVNIGRTVFGPQLTPLREKILGMPPWRFWGIDVIPVQPSVGLGLDFWSMKLRTDFPAHQSFLAGVFLFLLVVQAALVLSGARLVTVVAGPPSRRTALRAWLFVSLFTLAIFDVVHFLL